ncbi:MAG: hypothetical protein LQ342_003866 [Letrouitia transgressa]|nr:MAG: hypothetical protein LQ342_003866 [Letrouitia transgressa]
MTSSNKKDGKYRVEVFKKNGRLYLERRRDYPKTKPEQPPPPPPPPLPPHNVYEELKRLKHILNVFNDRLKMYERMLQEADIDKRELHKERDALQADYDMLEDKRNELQDKLKAMKDRHKTLEEASYFLEEENDILKQRNNTLEERNGILKREYQDMRYDRKRAEEDLRFLRDECYRRGWLWDDYLRRFDRR